MVGDCFTKETQQGTYRFVHAHVLCIAYVLKPGHQFVSIRLLWDEW